PQERLRVGDPVTDCEAPAPERLFSLLFSVRAFRIWHDLEHATERPRHSNAENLPQTGYHRGAFDVGAEVAKEREETELDEEGEAQKVAAHLEDLAKFLTAAIGQFEGRFTITPREKVEALRRVAQGLEPRPRPRRGRAST